VEMKTFTKSIEEYVSWSIFLMLMSIVAAFVIHSITVSCPRLFKHQLWCFRAMLPATKTFLCECQWHRRI